MNITSKAEEKARNLGRQDLLRIEQLPQGLGIVAYFNSDHGLRSLGQSSLVQSNNPGYGLVIAADGAIPRDAGASDLLDRANMAVRPQS